MNGVFKAIGGARVGWANATWPLARLTATSNSLRVAVLLSGKYDFTPHTVVAITRYTMIPFFGWGIRIEHSVADYPANFIFWYLGNPDALLRGLREIGFQPLAPASAIPERHGFALRWQALAIAALIWNSFYMIDAFRDPHVSSSPHLPGSFSTLADGLLLVAVLATIHAPAFQRLVFKPGRSIDEIRPMLYFVAIILASILVVLLLITAFPPAVAPGHAP